jgi:hypothetical protein
VRRHGAWSEGLAAARCPNYPFAVLSVLHLPMSYAAVVLASGSAGEAPPWQRDAALTVAVVVLIAVPVVVILGSALLVPRRFHAHVTDRADWVQARLPLLAPSGHLAPADVDRALGSVIGKFRVPCGGVAAVPFVPSLLLCAASVVSPRTVGGCIALFAALLVSFAALIPLYLLLRPYRWPCLNVTSAANVLPVLGLLVLMIAELQSRVGTVVDAGIAVLLAAQTALAAVTVALSVAQLLLSARMDRAKCLGEVLWTVPRWSPRCLRRCLWATEEEADAASVLQNTLLDAVDGGTMSAAAELPFPAKERYVLRDMPCTKSEWTSTGLVGGDPRLFPLRGIVATLRGHEGRSPLEQHVALALLVEAVCCIGSRHRRAA